MAKLLLVEDDRLLQKTLAAHLKKQNYTVETLESGQEALYRLKDEHYDLVILDWGLEDLNGIEVIKQYRGAGGKTPILMLTGKSQTLEKETGLDSGADDYLTKPFETVELNARIRALLRRLPMSHDNTLTIGNVRLDTTNGFVFVDDKQCELFPKEFALLEFFMRYPNHVFPANVIVDRLWSTESGITGDTVRAYLTKLRAKLKGHNANIEITTRKGFGYLLEQPTE